MLDLGIATLVGALAIDQGTGRADLHAHAAGNAGALAQRHAQVGHDHAVGAAFFDAQGEIADQFTAGANAAAAEDAAVVFQDEELMRGIHLVVFASWAAAASGSCLRHRRNSAVRNRRR